MANTIDVRNILAGNDVIVGDVKIAPGASHSFDRKQVVIGRYSPYDTYAASLYRDLAHALAATTPPITVTYNGVALTVTTLAELTDVDTQFTNEEYEVAFSFDDAAVAGYSAWWQAPVNLTVTAVEFTAAVAIVASDINFADMTVTDETGAAALATITTEVTGGSGDIAQWATYSIPLTAVVADLDLDQGAAVSIVLTNPAAGGGLGVGVTGTLKIKYTKRLA